MVVRFLVMGIIKQGYVESIQEVEPKKTMMMGDYDTKNLEKRDECLHCGGKMRSSESNGEVSKWKPSSPPHLKSSPTNPFILRFGTLCGCLDFSGTPTYK